MFTNEGLKKTNSYTTKNSLEKLEIERNNFWSKIINLIINN